MHETHFDSKMKDSVETTSNPFYNESTFLSTDNRATQRKKNKGISKSKRSRQNEKIDADLASEKGVVNILYDSKWDGIYLMASKPHLMTTYTTLVKSNGQKIIIMYTDGVGD